MLLSLPTTLIPTVGVNGLHSVLGGNYRRLCTKYDMNLNNIMKVWNERCATDEEIIRKCEHVHSEKSPPDQCYFAAQITGSYFECSL